MLVADSRRLTGPSLLLDRPGAILEVHLDPARVPEAAAAWREAARRLLDAVGWSGETLATRTFATGASLALSAPADALYAATDLNETAWGIAEARLSGTPAPDEAAAVARLRAAIGEERNPRLTALREAAQTRGLVFLSGEGLVSAGSGTGAAVWPADALPAADAVDWARVHDVPLALVTGSNGKTTVVRLLAAMLSERGRTVGATSTDGVRVGGATIAEGDYSGPSGARLLLRRTGVEAAVLETARGGLLRRGLPVEHAGTAVVTNVADDHLGEFGIDDLRSLAEVKLLVGRAVRPGGALVLNADDPVLREAAAAVRVPVVWFSLEPDQPAVERHVAGGGRAAWCEDGRLVLAEGTARVPVAAVADVPMTLGGAARHNVANALAAMGAAWTLGVSPAEMGAALGRFGREPDDNVGRANVFDLGGVRVVVDFAHNPHGMAALARMVASMPAHRRLVLLGQAGDRSDEAIRELVRAALPLRPDRVVLKDMEHYLRGRTPGEIPAVMADELARSGIPPAAIARPGSELASVRDALAWAAPGDLLLLTVHQDRPLVLALIEQLRAAGWRAGDPLAGAAASTPGSP